MKKSIYRKAAESIANGDKIVNGRSVCNANRIYSCIVIDALSGYWDYSNSYQRDLYENFMCYDPEFYLGRTFDSDDQAIIALLLFDEIVKHGDHKD